MIRDGVEQKISAENLVVGDLIIIRNGGKVPADARILYSSELKLETSSITGEAEPIEFSEKIVPKNVSVFESRNIAFNGSFCVDGEAIALVIRTGDQTVIDNLTNVFSLSFFRLSVKSHRLQRIKMSVRAQWRLRLQNLSNSFQFLR